MSYTLHIEQRTQDEGKHTIQLALERPGQPRMTAQADIEFALTPDEQRELKWYLENYLQRAASVTAEHVQQIESWMKTRGEELYRKVLRANDSTVDLWGGVRDHLADLRVEITTGVADAAAIPWELMYEPKSDSEIALRVKSFVRVQSDPNISFVQPADTDELGRVRLLYVVCRPSGTDDVELRAVVNQLLQTLEKEKDLDRFDITALRPPTYERLQKELSDAKNAGRPYHIVHFDGHGIYADLEKTTLADWSALLSSVMLKADSKGKHGYLLFEHPGSDDKMRPVSGDQLGKLLHDNGVPVLVLNACQSAMDEATDAARSETGQNPQDVHDEVRAIGSLAQAVVDQGIPAVLGMRYSVYVVTAAQYIGRLYSALAKGRGFGQAATEGRKDLHENPERWVGLQPRPLQDWFVPVVYEAAPLRLFPDMTAKRAEKLREHSRAAASQLDPVQNGSLPVRYVPDTGFIGRDETLLMLDRAFDTHPVVLLHAYAGQGKTTTAVEFARWYATTGGLGDRPNVLLTSFETTTTLRDVLDTIGQAAVEDWSAVNRTDEKQQRVLAVLRGAPLLWIWDNVEPVAGFPAGTESNWMADEQRELADFLKLIKLDRATRAKVLLTSRRDEQQWLGGIPHRVRMPRMRGSDAARMALELGAERNLTRTEINSWQPLLDYCGGNPLTLRVIVGQAVRMGLWGENQIEAFVQAVRDGEQQIEDADEAQGRDRSLGASLDYGFRNAFNEDELPIVALLHLFQGTANSLVLFWMGVTENKHALPEVQGRSKGYLKELLTRATEIGFMTHAAGTWYLIHPALSWFLRPMFDRFYDGTGGRSSARAASRSWIEAIAAVGRLCREEVSMGDPSMSALAALEESNLRHAQRIAVAHGWWSQVISIMQGLHVLYHQQGRMAEWSRLVIGIVSEYCTENDEPKPGREEDYRLVMEYRADLARTYERDLERCETLLNKLVDWDRQHAAFMVNLDIDASLDDRQCHYLRNLAVTLTKLGQLFLDKGNAECVKMFQEAMCLTQRIKERPAEAIAQFNLGNAYKDIPEIRDLNAAQSAYERGSELFGVKDWRGLAGCNHHLGMLHHIRFREGSDRNAPLEERQREAEATVMHIQKALSLLPASATKDLATCHGQLGVFFSEIGQTEQAREHFETAAQFQERIGDRYDSGRTRGNIANMYLVAARRQQSHEGRHDLLIRGRAYAEAGLRDFQHYEGRAAADEARAQQLIDDIQQMLDQPV